MQAAQCWNGQAAQVWPYLLVLQKKMRSGKGENTWNGKPMTRK